MQISIFLRMISSVHPGREIGEPNEDNIMQENIMQGNEVSAVQRCSKLEQQHMTVSEACSNCN